MASLRPAREVRGNDKPRASRVVKKTSPIMKSDNVSLFRTPYLEDPMLRKQLKHLTPAQMRVLLVFATAYILADGDSERIEYVNETTLITWNNAQQANQKR
jgi:hypothetical protein